MNLKNPVVAYVASSNLESHVIVTMLEVKGVPAYAVEDQSGASLWMFGTISQFHKPKIYVDQNDLDKATGLIRRFEEKERARRNAHASDTMIDVLCEECGKNSQFPESQRGTVQDCPHCGEYMDVGSPSWNEETSLSDDLDEPEQNVG